MSRTLSVCRWLQRYLVVPGARTARSLSSLKQDPSKFISGLTWAQVESNPSIAAYLKANFPEAYEEQKDTTESDGAAEVRAEDTKGAATIESSHNIRTLTCYLRDTKAEEGSRSCRRLRGERMIPGLLYGGDPTLGIYSQQPKSKTFIKTQWKLLQSELDKYHRSFESRVYDLTVLESPDDDSEGEVHRVVPKNVQRHPLKSTVFCANFCRYHAGRPLKIPLDYINEEESPILKRDGFIIPIQRFVEIFVEDGAPIPEKIELECTDLKFKEVIRLDRLILPEGVRFSDRVLEKGDDLILGVVSGKSREEEKPEGTEEEEQAE